MSMRHTEKITLYTETRYLLIKASPCAWIMVPEESRVTLPVITCIKIRKVPTYPPTRLISKRNKQTHIPFCSSYRFPEFACSFCRSFNNIGIRNDVYYTGFGIQFCEKFKWYAPSIQKISIFFVFIAGNKSSNTSESSVRISSDNDG